MREQKAWTPAEREECLREDAIRHRREPGRQRQPMIVPLRRIAVLGVTGVSLYFVAPALLAATARRSGRLGHPRLALPGASGRPGRNVFRRLIL